MNKIIINVEPFLLMQKAYCFNGDLIQEETEIRTSELDTALFQLIEDNDVEELNIAGNIKYTQKIKESILSKELTKYGINKINVKLI